MGKMNHTELYAPEHMWFALNGGLLGTVHPQKPRVYYICTYGNNTIKPFGTVNIW
jgi:hypothetical protein